MASYTDIIPKFNPYIQQLPVEAMVQVGMQKQQQYEQGVQKIQSEIDQVAGLDIAKGIHKEYLQSKLNNLGTQLATVAAGDFSNFQLVNSVSSMTNQIVKDKNCELDCVLVDDHNLDELKWQSQYITEDQEILPGCLFFGKNGKWIINFERPIFPFITFSLTHCFLDEKIRISIVQFF